MSAGPARGTADRAPRIASVQLTPSSITRLDKVTATVTARDPDGDRVRLSYRWLRNGKVITGVTGDSIRLPLHRIVRGDRIAVRVTASDRLRSVTETSSALTVRDAPPQVSSLAIDQQSPTVATTLTASLVASDPDGDPLHEERTWSWSCPDRPPGTANGVSLDLSAHGIVRGCHVGLADVVSDGRHSVSADTANVTVVNSAPELASVTIDEGAPLTNDTLHAVVDATDADGDALTTGYRWFVNGLLLDGQTGPSLDLSQPGNGDQGDEITVEATVDDGAAQTTATSQPVTVANSAPTIEHVVIHYDPATATASVSATAGDADGGALITNVRWTIDGLDAGSDATLDVAAANAHIGATLGARVWMTDAQGASSGWLMAPEVTVTAGVPPLGPMNTWRPLTDGYESDVTAVVADSGREIYMGEQLGLRRSEDGGDSWTSLHVPCTTVQGLADDPTDPAIVYLGCWNGGVYRSSDAGDTWHNLNLIDSQTMDPPSVWALAVDPASPDTVYAVTQGSSDLYRSTDDGATWHPLGPIGFGISIAIDPSNDQHIVLGTDHGVIVTTDGGGTWSSPAGPSTWTEVAFDPSDASHLWAVLYKASTPSVLQSSDGGFTWTTIAGSPAHLTTLATAPGLLYVGGTGSISRTEDNGTTWERSSSPVLLTPTALAVDATDTNTAYVGYASPAGIWRVPFTSAASQGQMSYLPLRFDGVTDVTPTSMTLHATVAPMLEADYGWVLWGISLTPGGSSGPLMQLPIDTHQHEVSYQLTGLQPDTTYYLNVSDAIEAYEFVSDTTPYQATFTTPPATGQVAPADAAPVIDSASIDQGSPTTTGVLHAEVSAHDPDGDALTYAYQWNRNGAPIPGATQSSLDLAQPGNGDRGDEISVTVTADDGVDQASSTSDPVTVADTAPTLVSGTIIYDPATGTATMDTVAHDADSDPLSTMIVWTVNGQDATSAATLHLAQVGATIGDTIGARVRVDDGTMASAWIDAADVSIQSGPPQLVAGAVMPWALTQGSFSTGSTVVISTDNSSGSNGAVVLDYLNGGTCTMGGGANIYASEISGALTACAPQAGQVLAVKTGQNAGPTALGLDTRITAYQPFDQIAQGSGGGPYIVLTPASPQLVRIPVVVGPNGASTWPSGSGTVSVVGYAWAVITGYANQGAEVYATVVGSA